jgi:hypothetical protein
MMHEDDVRSRLLESLRGVNTPPNTIDDVIARASHHRARAVRRRRRIALVGAAAVALAGVLVPIALLFPLGQSSTDGDSALGSLPEEQTLVAGGIQVVIPDGWFGRVYYIHGYTRPVVRLATFELPESDDIQASSARSSMRDDDVLMGLTEYSSVCPCPGFQPMSPPYAIRDKDFQSPFNVWHDLPPQAPEIPVGHSLARRTFEAEHRFFDLWVEFGHSPASQDAVDATNGLLASLSIGDFEPPLQPDGLCNEWSLNKDPDCPTTIWIKSVLSSSGFDLADGPQESTLVGEGGGARFFIWVREPSEPLESSNLKRNAVIAGVQIYGGTQLVWRAQGLNVWIAPGPDGQDALPNQEQLTRLVEASLDVEYPPD